MNAAPLPQSPRVLVVDDNAAIHQDFRKILGPAIGEASSRLGALEADLFDAPSPTLTRTAFRVDSAYQGQEALEKVQQALAEQDPYAVIFMDIRMPPGWDGVETTERIWQLTNEVQVVLCSAYSDYTWDDFLAKFGPTDNLLILKKPFETVEVLQVVHALTRKWALTQQSRRWLDELEQRVRERTRELEAANAQLRAEISERARVQTALHSSEERFATAFRTSPMPMAILHRPAGRILDANDRFSQLTGYSGAELREQPAHALTLWPQETWQRICALTPGRPLHHHSCPLQPKASPPREVIIWAEPISLDDGPCALLIVEDVTEQRRLETQLRQAQKMEAVGRLAAGVAHEFNNILTVIQGHAELLRDEQLSHRQIADSGGRISRASQRAAALTKQLLAFSRQQPVQLKSLHLDQIVRATQEMLRQLLGERYELSLDCPTPSPAIRADEGNLEQILINLCLNARDAMPGGGGIRLATTAVTLTAAEAKRHADARPGEFALLSVTDHGCGMGPDILRRLFDPFFTTKEIGKGTGLGLSTIHGIVRQHQGWIEVASQPGQGTTFSVYFPLARSEARPRATRELETSFVAPFGNGEAALVVEDDPCVRDLARATLERGGFQVYEAADAPTALNIWEESAARITVLVTDMVLPNGMSGGRMAQMLQARRPDLQVICISGYGSEMLRDELPATLAPGVNFLAKPFDPHTLLEAIRTPRQRPPVPMRP